MPSKILSSKELLNKNLFNKENTHPEKHTSSPIRFYQGPQVEHDISDIFLLPCFVNVRENSKKAPWAQSTCTNLISATQQLPML